MLFRSGKILDLPDLTTILLESEKPYIIYNEYQTLTLEDLKIDMKKMYIYSYHTEGARLVIEEHLATLL